MARGPLPRKRREYGRKNAVLTGLGVKGFGAGKLVEKQVAPQETSNTTTSPKRKSLEQKDECEAMGMVALAAS
jgi:hypothetical protein